MVMFLAGNFESAEWNICSYVRAKFPQFYLFFDGGGGAAVRSCVVHFPLPFNINPGKKHLSSVECRDRGCFRKLQSKHRYYHPYA